MRGLPISMQVKQEAMEEMGISLTSPEALTMIFKVNPGNSFGQTPLHLLAASKRTKLLLRFLEVVFDHNAESDPQ